MDLYGCNYPGFQLVCTAVPLDLLVATKFSRHSHIFITLNLVVSDSEFWVVFVLESTDVLVLVSSKECSKHCQDSILGPCSSLSSLTPVFISNTRVVNPVTSVCMASHKKLCYYMAHTLQLASISIFPFNKLV